ncbi:hypothetical protein JRQ81_008091 [Phrynocephalus forsythii]|uniref:Gem-associated protein 4 n=1 Tax=Phrynocephalus forsythii TaxID=171643 RepID=A0A9Q0XD62_9SAUR|nr:hypothetical protein JRQ81_008091 [Phrynocephalus forsythii]
MALPWPVTICGDVTVLHGGFLLASRLCHPKPLSELTKADWPVVGKPIVEALQEICTSYSAYPPQPEAWKEKAAVVLWSKILSSDPSGPAFSANQRWKDDPFFSAANAIPEVNRTVLYELFKALGASRLFARLLRVLPDPVGRREAEALVEYMAKDTSPDDAAFFLNVWGELMKQKDGAEDRLTAMFRAATRQYLPDPDEADRPPKRFKGDPPPLTGPSSVAVGILPVLTEGLKLIKESIVPAKMKCHAVANLLEALSISLAPHSQPEELPVRTYLDKISSVVTLWSSDGENPCRDQGLEQRVKEAERSVSILSVAQGSGEASLVDFAFLRSLLEEWSPDLQGILRDPQQICYESYRLLDRLASLEKILASYAEPDPLQTKKVSELAEFVVDFSKKINPESWSKTADRDLVASVAAVIIDKRMDRHAEVCAVFAAEKDWALSREWVACLGRNKDLFQTPELVLRLLETAVEGGRSTGRFEQQTGAAKVLLECYSQLPLADQNAVVAGVLAAWSRRGLSATWAAFSEGFQEELNVAFNQIIQSASGDGFQKAVASVARLVVLNPEATVKKVVHLAVANLGTHRFLAEILRSFPALRFREPTEAPGESAGLVMSCLKEAVWGRLSSAKEKEQFLEFLVYLLQPNGAGPLLQLAEVTRHLVLPSLKSDSPSVELSLRILDQLLRVSSEEGWIQSCHPFPLLLALCRLLDGFGHYWHAPAGQRPCPLEAKDLVADNLGRLAEALVAQKEAVPPELWTQSVSWLHKKTQALDWTVGLRLKGVFGQHFKNEAPATLFEVCQLPGEEWAACPSPSYGAGSGLLAWMECCCVSTALQEEMLARLAVNVDNPEEVNLFSKGFIVALVQVFPWCSHGEWRRLVHVIRNLLDKEVLYVPYSLEYVHHLPLLDLRPFAFHLRFSVLMLRAFQFLCGASGATWLPGEAWKHVSKLYCLGVSDLLGSLKGLAQGQGLSPEGKPAARALSFVYIQVFCHALHVAAMLPEEAPDEGPVLLALEVLARYETLHDADEAPGSALRKANERHFLASVAENITHAELRAMILQKLRKM